MHDLGQCHWCDSRLEQPLLWELLLPHATPSPPPSQSNFIVICSDDESDDDDDDESNQPPQKKSKKNEQDQKEKECCTCYDKKTPSGKILTTFCCRHSAHVSCLHKHELPSMCPTPKERKRVAIRLGIPNCLVCRSKSGNVVGLDGRMVQELLPREATRNYLWGEQEANWVLNRCLFDTFLEKFTKPWKEMMCIDQAIVWVM